MNQTNSNTGEDELRAKVKEAHLKSLYMSSHEQQIDVLTQEIAKILKDGYLSIEEVKACVPEKQYMHQFYEGNTAELVSRKEANREVTVIRDATIDQMHANLDKLTKGKSDE